MAHPLSTIGRTIRPRVLFICHEASRTGAPIVLLNLLRWLRDDGRYELGTVLIRSGDLAPAFEQVSRVFYVQEHPGRPRRVAALRRTAWNQQTQDLSRSLPSHVPMLARRAGRRGILAALRREIIESFRPDLVYLNSAFSGAALGFIPGGIPIISHVHELGFQLRLTRRYAPTSIELMLARTDRYIAASGAVARLLEADFGICQDRISTVHDFIVWPSGPVSHEQVTDYRRRLGVDEQELLVGCLGTVEWRKGPDVFIELAARVVRRHATPVTFAWAGATLEFAWDEATRHDLAAVNLGSQLRFLGPLPDPSRFLAALDVFALTSRSDPFPLVCLEAAAHGVPVVAFAAGGAPEFLGGEDDLVAPYLDIEAMARTIEGLLASASAREATSARLANRVRELYSVQAAAPAIAEQIDIELAQAIGSGRRGVRVGW